MSKLHDVLKQLLDQYVDQPEAVIALSHEANSGKLVASHWRMNSGRCPLAVLEDETGVMVEDDVVRTFTPLWDNYPRPVRTGSQVMPNDEQSVILVDMCLLWLIDQFFRRMPIEVDLDVNLVPA